MATEISPLPHLF